MKKYLFILIMPILVSHSYAASCKVNAVDLTAEYSGECKDGFANGKGIVKGKNSYAGEFINGNRSGIGAYMWANGDHYVGRWVDDKKTQGTFTWANGDHYVGKWIDDKKTQGTFTWANGDRYNGSWEDDKKARGYFTWANGDFYNGSWKDDKKTHGDFEWTNGDNYVGKWVDDKKTRGTFTWANGDRYSGLWLDNNRSGYGRMILTKQSHTQIENWIKNKLGSWQGDFYVVEGVWKNDKLIRECQRIDCDPAIMPKK